MTHRTPKDSRRETFTISFQRNESQTHCASSANSADSREVIDGTGDYWKEQSQGPKPDRIHDALCPAAEFHVTAQSRRETEFSR